MAKSAAQRQKERRERIKQGKKPDPIKSTPLQKARIRKLDLETRRIKFDQAIKEGKYLPANMVEKDWTRVLRMCRDSLLSIPARVSPILVSLAMDANQYAIYDILDKEIRESLSNLVKDMDDIKDWEINKYEKELNKAQGGEENEADEETNAS